MLEKCTYTSRIDQFRSKSFERYSLFIIFECSHDAFPNFKFCRQKMCRFRVNGRPIRQIVHYFQNVPASSADTLPNIGGRSYCFSKRHCLFLLFSNERSFFLPTFGGGGTCTLPPLHKCPPLPALCECSLISSQIITTLEFSFKEFKTCFSKRLMT